MNTLTFLHRASVFDSSGATPYHVLDVVPDLYAIPTKTMPTNKPPAHPQIPLPSNPVTQMQILGLGITSVALPPTSPVTQILGPGITSVVLPPTSPVTQLLGLGIAPVTMASVTPLHLTAVPLHSDIMAPEADLSSSTSGSQARLKEAQQRKYTYTTPLKPGHGCSAK
jgi:hypothetical protein